MFVDALLFLGRVCRGSSFYFCFKIRVCLNMNSFVVCVVQVCLIVCCFVCFLGLFAQISMLVDFHFWRLVIFLSFGI